MYVFNAKCAFGFFSKDGNKDCTAPDYPFQGYGTIGAKGVDGKPLICGGLKDNPTSYEERCFSLVNGEWKNKLNMTEKRASASVVTLGDQVGF